MVAENSNKKPLMDKKAGGKKKDKGDGDETAPSKDDAQMTKTKRHDPSSSSAEHGDTDAHMKGGSDEVDNNDKEDLNGDDGKKHNGVEEKKKKKKKKGKGKGKRKGGGKGEDGGSSNEGDPFRVLP